MTNIRILQLTLILHISKSAANAGLQKQVSEGVYIEARQCSLLPMVPVVMAMMN